MLLAVLHYVGIGCCQDRSQVHAIKKKKRQKVYYATTNQVLKKKLGRHAIKLFFIFTFIPRNLLVFFLSTPSHPNRLNLFSSVFSAMSVIFLNSSLIHSFLILSNLVTPHIYLNILVSANFIFFFSFLYNTRHIQIRSVIVVDLATIL